ncbi:DUF3617 domain-containing protein [Sphingomonas hankyongi]|uniref:DUF3617 domain-containing protein n=1 Tax=Sphingomonas hankyongi TaxID=2908209 RepID=A0ABT0RYS8_9SPHN|nr:DUF3617 family protein [Sphingomonas hankyongi]MCL6728548.1 DUF3617 domain-containing protein [Sphingomonas hankyongi]
MRKRFTLSIIGAATLGAWTLAVAQPPNALAQTSPGLYEIAGLPGAKAPARECIGDVTLLGQFEHRRNNCTRKVLASSGNTVTMNYECKGGGFGQSKLTVITPRNLRVETQGISDGLPFNYVLQARRMGECAVKTPASVH